MDGTGPMGQGEMTGRGRGNCKAEKRMFCCGRRSGANSQAANESPKDRLEILEEGEKMLINELESIQNEIKALKEEKK